MTTQALTIELPEELVELLGSIEAARAKAWEALILHLLREGEISQGRAARLLGITRWDLIDLMAKYQIPSGLRTLEDVEQEGEAVRRLADQSLARRQRC